MTYQHLSQTERYQIYIRMKDRKTQIAKLMDRHKSTIITGLARNTGLKGCRLKQACLVAEERTLSARNANQITATDWGKTVECLLVQLSPVQIANQVGVSRETIHRHV
jgi:IS30 family transposase